MERRDVLAVTTTVLTAGVAGCSSSDSGANVDPTESEVTVSPDESLQDNINKVKSGGTVRIEEGVYNTAISIPRNMTITSEGGAIITPEDEEDDGSGVTINAADVTINNISVDSYERGIDGRADVTDTVTLSNISANGCGIGVTIDANTVELDEVTATECITNGAAIILPLEGELTITDSRFTNCGLEAYERWPGLYIEGGTNIGIDNTVFAENDGTSITVRSGNAKGQTVALSNCSISGEESNSFEMEGTFGEDTVQIENSTFSGRARHVSCGYDNAINSFTITSSDVTAPSPPDVDSLITITGTRDGVVNVSDCFISLDDHESFDECNGVMINGGQTVNVSTSDIVGIEGTALHIDNGKQGQTVAVEDCRCNEATNNGIYHGQPAVGVGTIEINRCTANNNGDYGLYIESENVTITDTEATGNEAGGLNLTNIERREATLNGNTFIEK